MKKLILPSIFTFTLLFSCNNDDNSSIDPIIVDPNINAKKIIGTWGYESSKIKYSNDGKIEDDFDPNPQCTVLNKYTFTEDNKYKTLQHYYHRGECMSLTEEYTYKVEGDKLFVNFEIEDTMYVIELHIEELTATDLIMSNEGYRDYDGDGKNETIITHFKR
ncbi:lipocalin family protein [Empedobacter brevis]|uniref:lipocalin family protein n=1 Tax=Empedobacter brevis TaxID=247 RepID=UPI0039B0F9E9